MTISNPEPGGGGGEPGPVLRREAAKALSGRVPLVLAIVLALLSGVLIGYGVRAFTAGQCAQRELRCPRQTRARPLIVPPVAGQESDCKPRLRLLPAKGAEPDKAGEPDKAAEPKKATEPEKAPKAATPAVPEKPAAPPAERS